jgi:tetratricopeptide (TPR) repeat protein
MLLATFLVSAAAQQATDKLLEKGDEFISLGKPTQARAEYEKAQRAGAKLEDDFSRSRNLGFAYLNGTPHDFAKAAQWLGNASRLRPADEEVTLGLAQALSWSGNPTAALQPWRALCEKNPQNTDFAIGLANALWATGNRSECFANLQHMVEAAPSNIRLRLEYARLLGYAKDYPAASVQYESVLQIDPTNLDAQVGTAKLLSWQQSYASSIEKYDQVLKASPKFYPALVGKAYSLLWMGKDEEARKYFQMALNQNPRDPEVVAPLRKLNAAIEEAAKAQQAAAKKTQIATKEAPVADTTAATEKPVEQETPATAASAEESTAEVEAPPAVDPVAQLMTEADTASAQSDYTTAIAGYRKVLVIAPDNQEASIRLARVLSWAKQYDASIDQYSRVLGDQKAQNYQTRLERARVLSWAQKYDVAIHEYESLAAELGSTPVGIVSVRDIRIELARVESWAKQYDQSLAEINKLIPQNPTAADTPALLLKARVLAYKQRYSQSIATYNKVLSLQPRDQEARFGKAQAMYWSGDLSRSRPMLRTIVTDEPGNADARLALASVEHGTGNSHKAITLLDTLPPSSEVQNLRTAIEESMRPVLRERFGWEDDIETPTAGLLPTTVRGLRLSSSYEFSVRPDIRMEISNTIAHGDTSNPTLGRYGSGSFAQETMLRVTFQPTSWLRLTTGAGVGTTGAGFDCPQPLQGPCTPGGNASRTQRPVYDIRPVISWNKLRVELSSSRHVADYTPLAVHDNAVQLRQQASASYEFEHLRVGGEYRYQNFTVEPGDKTAGLPSRLGANSHGGTAYVTPRLYRNDRVTIEAGFRYDVFGFGGGAEQIGQSIPTGYGTAGFFAPRVYERYAGTGHIAWELPRKIHLELDGTFGPQRIFGFDSLLAPPAKWGTTGTTSAQISKSFGRFRPFLAYEFFTTATPAGPTQTDGSYTSHVIMGGFSLRF